MPILTIIITIAIVGVLLWLINTYIPMEGRVKKILNIVVIICLVVWLLRVFGVWGHIETVHTMNTIQNIFKS